MALYTKNRLPAADILAGEGIVIPGPGYGGKPLEIALVNLMPLKERTETDFIRLLSACHTDINLTLVTPLSHKCRNTSQEYIDNNYIDLKEMIERRPDGVIVTGAPIEHLPFEEVDYWPELVDMMDTLAWMRIPTLYICWGALAGLYHHHGVMKLQYRQKVCGVFPHTSCTRDPLMRGMSDTFYVPHSRYSGVSLAEVQTCPTLKLLSVGDRSGMYIAAATEHPNYYITGHSEYAAETLDYEYHRDMKKGLNPDLPVNYYPDDDPSKKPEIKWRSHAHLLFNNWIGIVLADRYSRT